MCHCVYDFILNLIWTIPLKPPPNIAPKLAQFRHKNTTMATLFSFFFPHVFFFSRGKVTQTLYPGTLHSLSHLSKFFLMSLLCKITTVIEAEISVEDKIVFIWSVYFISLALYCQVWAGSSQFLWNRLYTAHDDWDMSGLVLPYFPLFKAFKK